MDETLIFEDDERRIWRSEGGTPGEAGHWVALRTEWKVPLPATVEEVLARDVGRIKDAVGDVAQPWVAGEPVRVGDKRAYQATVYACIQAHTTQADWPPDVVPALWGAQGPAAPPVGEWPARLSAVRSQVSAAGNVTQLRSALLAVVDALADG